MSDVVGAHNDLHSEQGAVKGEHPGRSRNPVIKVADLAWLEFEKPDLSRAETFARAFGFGVVHRTADELQLRGTDAGAPCVLVRRGQRTRFCGVAFKAQDEVDVLRLADKTECPDPRPAGVARRRGRRADRSQRHAGQGRRRHARTARTARPAAARVQLRPRPPSHQRHPASAAGARRRSSVWDTWCCSPASTSRR